MRARASTSTPEQSGVPLNTTERLALTPLRTHWWAVTPPADRPGLAVPYSHSVGRIHLGQKESGTAPRSAGAQCRSCLIPRGSLGLRSLLRLRHLGREGQVG